MKPPICAVCGKSGTFAGDSIRFADYKPLPANIDGHPEGFECFCDAHLDAARALTHLRSSEAISLLRGQFGFSLDDPQEWEQPCPQCGERNWRHHDLFGQIVLRRKTSWIAGKIAWLGYSMFLLGILFLTLPWLQTYALICLGALTMIIPAYFLTKRLEHRIQSQVRVCKSCGYASDEL